MGNIRKGIYLRITSYVKPSYKDALSNNNSVLNATASTFVSHETRDKFITSTPMQTTNQSKDIHSYSNKTIISYWYMMENV
jgi:hypothetical protein